MSIKRILLIGFIFATVVLILVGTITGVFVFNSFKKIQQKDIDLHLQTVTLGLSQLIESKRSIVQQVVDSHDLTRSVETFSQDKLVQRNQIIRKYIPDIVGLAIFDSDGAIIGSPEKQYVGSVCISDLQKAIFEDNISHNAPVHNSSKQFEHYDITIPFDANDDQYFLLMSFRLQQIRDVLENFSNEDYFYQLHSKEGVLIVEQGINKGQHKYQSVVEDAEWVLSVTATKSEVYDILKYPQRYFIFLFLFLTSFSLVLVEIISRYLQHDFKALHKTVKRIDKKTRIYYHTPILKDFHQLYNDIYKLSSELQSTQNELSEVSIRDSLTNLHNRRFLEQNEQRYLNLPSRNTPVTIALIDLNNFKLVNDELGHVYGDKVLVKVAETLKLCVRKTDDIYRIGGDEFLVILIDSTLEQSQLWQQKIKQQCAELEHTLVDIKSLSKPFGLSIGLAPIPLDSTSLETILSIADKAMYSDKQNKC